MTQTSTYRNLIGNIKDSYLYNKKSFIVKKWLKNVKKIKKWSGEQVDLDKTTKKKFLFQK